MKEKDDERKSLHIVITKALHKKLKQFAANNERLIKDVVIDAITMYTKVTKSNK